MKRSSSCSRTYFRRPKVRELVPDNKLILVVLRDTCESHLGCYIPSGISDDTGFTRESVEAGLSDIEKRGLIKRDQKTGEIFLTDWFRDNKFGSDRRGYQAETAFQEIISDSLKNAVIEAIRKSPECGLKAELFLDVSKKQSLSHQAEAKAEVEENLALAAAEEKVLNPLPISKWSQKKNQSYVEFDKDFIVPPNSDIERDKETARSIRANWSEVEIQTALEKIKGEGLLPFPSNVLNTLSKGTNNAKDKPISASPQYHRGESDFNLIESVCS